MTAGAVAFGVIAMAVASGFVAFTLSGLRQSIIYGGLGHLQIRARDVDGARLDRATVAKIRARLAVTDGIEHQAARVEFQALVSAAAATVAAVGLGVDALPEAKIRALTRLTDGRWFTGRERTPRALLGSGLARTLGLRPGDLFSVIAYSDRGSMTAADLQVGGLFETGVIAYDDRTFFVPCAVAQSLMETDGLTSIAVTLRRPEQLPAFAETLAAALGGSVRVATWDALSPLYGRVLAMYEWILHALLVIVGVVVMLGITNTMSMAVLERVAEVGVLRALGFGRGRLAAMFLIEAGAIGALGAAVGLALAAGACDALSASGIVMPPPPGYSDGYVVEVPVVPRAFALAAVMAVVTAVVAGVGPSLRATRGEVSDALRAS